MTELKAKEVPFVAELKKLFETKSATKREGLPNHWVIYANPGSGKRSAIKDLSKHLAQSGKTVTVIGCSSYLCYNDQGPCAPYFGSSDEAKIAVRHISEWMTPEINTAMALSKSQGSDSTRSSYKTKENDFAKLKTMLVSKTSTGKSLLQAVEQSTLIVLLDTDLARASPLDKLSVSKNDLVSLKNLVEILDACMAEKSQRKHAGPRHMGSKDPLVVLSTQSVASWMTASKETKTETVIATAEFDPLSFAHAYAVTDFERITRQPWHVMDLNALDTRWNTEVLANIGAQTKPRPSLQKILSYIDMAAVSPDLSRYLALCPNASLCDAVNENVARSLVSKTRQKLEPENKSVAAAIKTPCVSCRIVVEQDISFDSDDMGVADEKQCQTVARGCFGTIVHVTTATPEVKQVLYTVDFDYGVSIVFARQKLESHTRLHAYAIPVDDLRGGRLNSRTKTLLFADHLKILTDFQRLVILWALGPPSKESERHLYVL